MAERARFTQTPHVQGGQWCIANTRIPARALWGAFRDGWNIAFILEQFPSPYVTQASVEEAIRFCMKRKARRASGQRAPHVNCVCDSRAAPREAV